jgi:hypothetical protein
MEFEKGMRKAGSSGKELTSEPFLKFLLSSFKNSLVSALLFCFP